MPIIYSVKYIVGRYYRLGVKDIRDQTYKLLKLEQLH